MFKIPKKLTVKGQTWQVSYKWNLHHEDGTRCDGLCDFQNRVIYLDRGATKESKRLAFLHELCHSIIHEAHADVDPVTEEIIVESISQFMDERFDIRWRK